MYCKHCKGTGEVEGLQQTTEVVHMVAALSKHCGDWKYHNHSQRLYFRYCN